LQGGQLLLPFDAGQGVAGVRGDEPGQVLGLGERRRVQAGPFDELQKLRAVLVGRDPRVRGLLPPKLLLVGRQVKRFTP